MLKRILIIFTVLLIIASGVRYLLENNLPEGGVLVTIPKGTSLKEASQLLKDYEIVRSRSLFSTFLQLKPGDVHVVAGQYIFEEPSNLFDVINQTTKGLYGFDIKKITLPEGLSAQDMSDLISPEVFFNYDPELFIELTRDKEGFLFPDTYSVPVNISTEALVTLLENTFYEKVQEAELTEDGIIPYDIVILASIVEREASRSTIQEIADILNKRLEIDMALQVDAPFIYSIGKNSSTLTLDELRDDNPYNTYTRKGLPPTPIGNPGIKTLYAVLNPNDTDYLYFITGDDGNMYYSETYEGHLQNISNYLTQ
jgi:UPF0755 protein